MVAWETNGFGLNLGIHNVVETGHGQERMVLAPETYECSCRRLSNVSQPIAENSNARVASSAYVQTVQYLIDRLRLVNTFLGLPPRYHV
jgi:hypothetical protein